MAKIKIGEKEYEVKINNRIIRDIESAFGGKSIEALMSNTSMSATDLCDFIYPTVKEHLTEDDFLDEIHPSQYIGAGKVVGTELVRAFTTTGKKK